MAKEKGVRTIFLTAWIDLLNSRHAPPIETDRGWFSLPRDQSWQQSAACLLQGGRLRGVSHGDRRPEGTHAIPTLWLLLAQQPFPPAHPADRGDDQPHPTKSVGLAHAALPPAPRFRRPRLARTI